MGWGFFSALHVHRVVSAASLLTSLTFLLLHKNASPGYGGFLSLLCWLT